MGLLDLLTGSTTTTKKKGTTTKKKSTTAKKTSSATKKKSPTKSKKTTTKKSASGVNITDAILSMAKSAGIDINTIISFVLKNQDVISALGKLGLKKGEDPASSSVQKLVGSLKTNINKAIGTKVDDDTFGSIVNKLMGNAMIKERVEDIAGDSVTSFIKKAVSEYIS